MFYSFWFLSYKRKIRTTPAPVLSILNFNFVKVKKNLKVYYILSLELNGYFIGLK